MIQSRLSPCVHVGGEGFQLYEELSQASHLAYISWKKDVAFTEENSCWGTGNVYASFLSFVFVAVPLVSELAVEILEKGEVRFWLQAEKLSGNAKANFVFNDKEIFNGEVRLFIAYRCLHVYNKWVLVYPMCFLLVFHDSAFLSEITYVIENITRKILSIVFSSSWILLDAGYKVELNDFLPPLWVPRGLLTDEDHKSSCSEVVTGK